MTKLGDFRTKLAQYVSKISSNRATNILHNGLNHTTKLCVILPSGEGSIEIFFEDTTESNRIYAHYYSDIAFFIEGKAEEIQFNHDELRNQSTELLNIADVDPVMLRNVRGNLFGFGGMNRQELQNWMIIGGVGIVGFLIMYMVM